MIDAFVQYLRTQLQNHSIYVWGAQGQAAPEITAQWIRRRETSNANAQRAIAYWQKQVAAGYGNALRAFDCSGLGVYFFLQHGLLARDMTANGLLSLCTPIRENALLSTDFVFRVNRRTGVAYHIGYLADENGTVIEAKGRSEGVVQSASDGWDVYARPPFFRNAAGEPKSRVLKLLSPYLRGGDVRRLQRALLARGLDAGAADGVFGPNTERAVRAFQRLTGLSVDGKAGRQTFAALGLPFVA